VFAEAFDICGSAGTDSKVVCHFKGLIFSKFLTKPELKALSWISRGICWGSSYVILQNSTEKVAAEPRWTCQAETGEGVSDAGSRGERGEVRGCSRCRLRGAGRHLWKPQLASSRCQGVGKAQTAHLLGWSGFCWRYIYSAEQENPKQRKV